MRYSGVIVAKLKRKELRGPFAFSLILGAEVIIRKQRAGDQCLLKGCAAGVWQGRYFLLRPRAPETPLSFEFLAFVCCKADLNRNEQQSGACEGADFSHGH